MMIRVLIADDQKLFNELLAHMLAEDEEIQVVAKAYDGEAVLVLAKNLKPDIILLDVSMPILNGIETLKKIREEGLPCKVLILTASIEIEDAQETIDAGANGYLLKSVAKERLLLAIKSIYAGMDVFDSNVYDSKNKSTVSRNTKGVTIELEDLSVDISEREIRIMQLTAEGKTVVEIANELYLTEGRVRNIITEMLGKLMLKDKTQLVVFAIKHKLVAIK